MRLHDLLDRVASADQPVSRLDADDLFAGGRRQRRRTRIVRGAGAFGATAVAVAVAVVVSTVGGTPQVKPAEAPASTFVVHSAGGFDRNHLWVSGEPAPGRGHVTASTTDGGRTWTVHGEPDPKDSKVGLIEAVDGKSGVSASVAGGLNPIKLFYTTDSWRTEGSVTLSDTPVAKAPKDALAFCQKTVDWTCPVSVFDPATRKWAPLANQPALGANLATRAPDGTIWVGGLDRSAKHPTVAKSTDGGVTWSIHVLTNLAPVTYENAMLWGTFMFGRNGSALLVMMGADVSILQVVRFSDGGWQQLPDINPRTDVATWLTADGTNVRQDFRSSVPSPDPSGGFSPPPTTNTVVNLRVCPPGRTEYHDIAPPKGFPTDQAMIGRVKSLADGYLGRNYGGLWTSPNGLTWQKVPAPR